MSKNKVVKCVSFNLTNAQDQLLLERIKDMNFSGYVKKLIEKDMKSRKIIKTTTENNQINPGTTTAIIIGSGSTLSLKSV